MLHPATDIQKVNILLDMNDNLIVDCSLKNKLRSHKLCGHMQY